MLNITKIREVHITTAMRCHLTLGKVVIIKKRKISIGEDVEERNPCALLVGMQTGAATMENSMEAPQKLTSRTTLWSSNPTSGYLSKGNENTNSEICICAPVFTAAVFTRAKTWKQPKCFIWEGMDEENTRTRVHTRARGKVIQPWREGNPASATMRMDLLPSEISQRERQTPHALTYVWNLKT